MIADSSVPPHQKESVPTDFVALAKRWYPDLSSKLLGLIWQGYDLLIAELPAGIDHRDLERSISQSLELRIRRVMTGDEPFDIQHGPYERETMQRPPAQPPQYDLAFVFREAERLMWPLEAKVLNTDSSVRSYVNDVRSEFLTCRYSPFSSQAAMIAYLLRGKPDKVFENIAAKVPCTMVANPDSPDRPWKMSDHIRSVPESKRYPMAFRCHHLILLFPSLSRLGKNRNKGPKTIH